MVKTYWYVIALFFSIAILYAPLIQSGWFQAEDFTYLTTKTSDIGDLGVGNKLVSGMNGSGVFRPLETVYVSFLNLLFNDNATGFHLFSVILHWFNCCFLSFLSIKLIKNPLPGFILAVCPIGTEAIAYYSASAGLLSAMTILVGGILITNTPNRKNVIALAIVFISGLCLKEDAIMLIPLLFVIVAIDKIKHTEKNVSWLLFQQYTSYGMALVLIFIVYAIIRHVYIDSIILYPEKGTIFSFNHFIRTQIIGFQYLGHWLSLFALALVISIVVFCQQSKKQLWLVLVGLSFWILSLSIHNLYVFNNWQVTYFAHGRLFYLGLIGITLAIGIIYEQYSYNLRLILIGGLVCWSTIKIQAEITDWVYAQNICRQQVQLLIEGKNPQLIDNIKAKWINRGYNTPEKIIKYAENLIN